MRIVKKISMKNYQFPDFLEILTRSCKYMVSEIINTNQNVWEE